MIKVTIGNNASMKTVILSEDTTLRTALENEGVDYAHGTTALDGCPLQPGQLDMSFSQLGVTNRTFLTNVTKRDNA